MLPKNFLSQKQEECLKNYVKLLLQWNSSYNLTAITDPDAIWQQHIMDSLSIVPYIGEAKTVLDVGTGAGLPGVVLAVVYPQVQFTLIDSKQKKARFIIQAAYELGLNNIEVRAERVENYQNSAGYDIIVSRAFASIADFIGCTQHLSHPESRFLAMKGQYPEQELATLAHSMQYECIKLNVEQLNAERHLVVLRNK